MSTHNKGRLEQLYEVSKLLTRFATAEETFDAALGVVGQPLALRSAILIEQAPSGFRMTLWPTDAEGTDSMRAAVKHLEESFAYLVGAASTEALGVIEELGPTRLQTTLGPARPAGGVEPFILIPLVVKGREIFGAIQMEAVRSFDESDLAFINILGNQLAVAVDRDRARRSDIARRERAETAEALADRKRVVAELLTEKFESLVDNLDHAFVWEADAKTFQLSFLSARAETLLGVPRQQWLEAAGGWTSFVHPEDRPGVEAVLRQAVVDRRDMRCDHRCVAPDGRVVWLHTGVHLMDAEGESPRLQGVSLDITAEKEAEDEKRFLQEATKTLGASLDSAAALKSVARLALPRLGDFCFFDVVTPDGSLRRQALAHFDPDKQRAFEEAFGDAPVLAADHPSIRVVQTRQVAIVSGLDEPLPLEEGATSLLRVPVSLGGRELAVLTFGYAGSGRRHGDSELALAEALATRAAFALENGRLYDQARRAIRAREQVLEVVSHDLRNPLGTILIAAQTLTRRHEDDGGPGPIKELKRIERAATSMLRFITDLLDYANIEAGRLSVTLLVNDATAILHETVANFAAAASAQHVKLDAEVLGAPLPPILCDRDRVLQVLSNLIGNALKMQPAGGSIELRAQAQGGEVVISVADKGPGLSPTDLRRIFERYERGQAVGYAGTGLGLAIASGILAQHRGRIWAASEPGNGATFYFTLPLAGAQASASPSLG